MMVSNATPLIYLAKAGQLGLLRKLYGQVFISEEVKKEVVDKGKELGKSDAFVIEKAIEEGWIKVFEAGKIKLQIELDTGEASTIALAKAKHTKEVLFDETSARTAARLAGLEPRGTVFVLLQALEKKMLDFDEFLGILKTLVAEGFRLKEEVYMEAIERAKMLN